VRRALKDVDVRGPGSGAVAAPAAAAVDPVDLELPPG
jgi:hypothetical protein